MYRVSLVAQLVKNLPAMQQTWVRSIPGSGRSPGGGRGNPLQYSCPENSHGQRRLAGCSPWGFKESDTTEQLRYSIWVRGDLISHLILSGQDWYHYHRSMKTYKWFHTNVCPLVRTIEGYFVTLHEWLHVLKLNPRRDTLKNTTNGNNVWSMQKRICMSLFYHLKTGSLARALLFSKLKRVNEELC